MIIGRTESNRVGTSTPKPNRVGLVLTAPVLVVEGGGLALEFREVKADSRRIPTYRRIGAGATVLASIPVRTGIYGQRLFARQNCLHSSACCDLCALFWGSIRAASEGPLLSIGALTVNPRTAGRTRNGEGVAGCCVGSSATDPAIRSSTRTI